MAKPSRPKRMRRNDNRKNPYGCDSAGRPIIRETPTQTNGALGEYADENGVVYADIAPVDPAVQAAIEEVLKPAK